AQDREDAPDRDVHVDVGRAIQRIEQQQVAAARKVRRDRIGLRHLLRHQPRELSSPLVGAQENLVGQQVQFLLRLPLRVLRAGRAQRIVEGALADQRGDALAGQANIVHQGREAAACGIATPLLLDQKACQRGRAACGETHEGFSGAGPLNTRLARMSAASMVTRSSRVKRAPRAANSRLACLSRALSRALRTERALAKCACSRRRSIYAWNTSSARSLKRYCMPASISRAIAISSGGV